MTIKTPLTHQNSGSSSRKAKTCRIGSPPRSAATKVCEDSPNGSKIGHI